MNKQQFLCLVVSAILIGGSPVNILASTDVNMEDTMDYTMDMQALLREYVDAHEAVGASVGLIDRGKIQFFSYGKMASDGDEGVTEDTIFEIGSITKVFTTLALMDMVAKGEVQLDDPIEMYLPGVKVPEKDGKKITLRHLATHYSGLPRIPDHFNPKNPANPYADFSVEKLYEVLNTCTLRNTPGEQFEYSNLGMGLLGHILSSKASVSYEQLISDHILTPLNMKNTSISVSSEKQKQFAKGHHVAQTCGYWDFSDATAGCGGIRSTVKDMTQFLAANMGLVNSPITDLMRKCHEQQHAPLPTMGIGLGWIINWSSEESKIIMHNGGTGGFRSYLAFDAEMQKGIVILTNSTEDWPDEFGTWILDPKFKRTVINHSLAKDPEYLNRFAGSYEATVFLAPDLPPQTLQVTVYGKQLAFSMTCGEVGLIYPESVGVFGVKGFPNGKIHFAFDEEGRVNKVQCLLLSSDTIAWEAKPLERSTCPIQ